MAHTQTIQFRFLYNGEHHDVEWQWEDYIALAYVLNNPVETDQINQGPYRLSFISKGCIHLFCKLGGKQKFSVAEKAVRNELGFQAVRFKALSAKTYPELPEKIKIHNTAHKYPMIYAEAIDNITYIAYEKSISQELDSIIQASRLPSAPQASEYHGSVTAQGSSSNMSASKSLTSSPPINKDVSGVAAHSSYSKETDQASSSSTRGATGQTALSFVEERHHSWQLDGPCTAVVTQKTVEESGATYILNMFETRRESLEVKGIVDKDVAIVLFPMLPYKSHNIQEHFNKSFQKLIDEFKPRTLAVNLEQIKHKSWPIPEFVVAVISGLQSCYQKQKSANGGGERLDIYFCSASPADFENIYKRVDTVSSEAALGLQASVYMTEKAGAGSVKKAGITIEVKLGSLETEKADALVCTLRSDLNLRKAGASAALLKAAGYQLQDELYTKYGPPHPLDYGEIADVHGHRLNCQYVLLGVMNKYDPKYDTHDEGPRKYFTITVYHFMRQCLIKAEKLDVKSLAFPAVGCGNLQFPVDITAKEMFQAVRDYEINCPASGIKHVSFVIYHQDEEAFEVFRKEEKKYILSPTREVHHSWELERMCTVVVTQKTVEESGATFVLDMFETRRKSPEMKSSIDKDVVTVQFPVLPYKSHNIQENLSKSFQKLMEDLEPKTIAVDLEQMKYKSWPIPDFVGAIISGLQSCIQKSKSADGGWESLDIYFCSASPADFENICKRVDAVASEAALGLQASVHMGGKDTEGMKKACIAIDVKFGSLELEKADALVCTMRSDLNLKKEGASAALLKAAGYQLQDELYTKYGPPHPLDYGEIADVHGHRLNCQYVLLGVMNKYDPKYDTHDEGPRKYFTITVYHFMRQCLIKAEKLDVKSLAFPAVGCGNLQFPVDITAKEMFQAVRDYEINCPASGIKHVSFVIYHQDEEAFEVFRKEEKKYKMKSSIDKDVVTVQFPVLPYKSHNIQENLSKSFQKLMEDLEPKTIAVDLEQMKYKSWPIPDFVGAIISGLQSCIQKSKSADDTEGMKKACITIDVKFGSLELEKADALVCTMRSDLNLRKAGASAALLKAAGNQLQDELYTKYGSPHPLDYGEIADVHGHRLNCQYVLLGVMNKYDPKYDTHDEGPRKYFTITVYDFMRQCLLKAEELGVRSLAFPAVGCGNLQFPVDIVAKEMFQAVKDYETNYPTSLIQHISFVIYHLDEAAFEDDVEHLGENLSMYKLEDPTSDVAGATSQLMKTGNNAAVDTKQPRDDKSGPRLNLSLPPNISKDATEFFTSKLLKKYSRKGLKFTLGSDYLECEGKTEYLIAFETEFRSAKHKIATDVSSDQLDVSSKDSDIDMFGKEFEEKGVFVEYDEQAKEIRFYGKKWHDIQSVKQTYKGRIFGAVCKTRGNRQYVSTDVSDVTSAGATGGPSDGGARKKTGRAAAAKPPFSWSEREKTGTTCGPLGEHARKTITSAMMDKGLQMSHSKTNTMPRDARCISTALRKSMIPAQGITGLASTTTICDLDLLKKCKDSKCPNLHRPVTSLPYLWQIKVFDSWLDIEEWEDVEKAFCDKKSEVFLFVESHEFSGHLKLQFVCDQILATSKDQSAAIEARRLSTISYTQSERHANIFTTQWRWYWQSDDEQYLLYSKEYLQYTLETKYLAGQQEYIFSQSHDKPDYQIAFPAMVQINENTNKVRNIIRRPLLVTAKDIANRTFQPLFTLPPLIDVPRPKHWLPWDHSEDYELVRLSRDCSEYIEVTGEFFKTLSRIEKNIVFVFRVQCPVMWRAFCSKETSMEAALKRAPHGRTTVNRQLLFHGTDTFEAVQGILTNNFDNRVSGKNATAYGDGVYFAKTARYSDNYTRGLDRYMFLADVLVGQSAKGEKGFRRPPAMPNSKHVLYDSCVDKLGDPKIFVIFDKSQHYPTYLIHYKNTDKTV